MAVLSIGRESFIGGDVEVEADVTIGNYTNVSTHVRLLARPQHACIADPQLVACGSARIPGWPSSDRRNRITIGNDVWIGRDAVLLADVTIGDGAIVGAFSVVARDVPPYAVVAGNPARIIRYRFHPEIIDALLCIEWWDWSDEVIAERAEDMRNVHMLCAKYAYEAYKP